MSLVPTVNGLFDKFQKAVGDALHANAGLYGQYHGAKELGDEVSMGVVIERAKMVWEPFRLFVGPCLQCNSTQIIRFEDPQDFYCPVCLIGSGVTADQKKPWKFRAMDGPNPA